MAITPGPTTAGGAPNRGPQPPASTGTTNPAPWGYAPPLPETPPEPQMDTSWGQAPWYNWLPMQEPYRPYVPPVDPRGQMFGQGGSPMGNYMGDAMNYIPNNPFSAGARDRGIEAFWPFPPMDYEQYLPEGGLQPLAPHTGGWADRAPTPYVDYGAWEAPWYGQPATGENMYLGPYAPQPQQPTGGGMGGYMGNAMAQPATDYPPSAPWQAPWYGQSAF